MCIRKFFQPLLDLCVEQKENMKMAENILKFSDRPIVKLLELLQTTRASLVNKLIQKKYINSK